MAVKLNSAGYDHAKRLIRDSEFVSDDRDEWSDHQPSADDENRFIERYGYNEYSRWHLGLDADADPDTKGHYRFPYGDFKKAHRCGLLAAESRAAQNKYDDIATAAHRLHEMFDDKN